MYTRPQLSDLQWAILKTIAYADIFDYPLSCAEIHRYLIDCKASLTEVKTALHTLTNDSRHMWYCEPYYGLGGREQNFAIRQRRSQHARTLWQAAQHYGSLMGQMPFVRMVAVTGSLAVDNAPKTGDIDYLVVTAPNRLWLARLLIVVLVRFAQQRGFTLCPNYLISENTLHFEQHNLYTAREIVQMIPVSNLATYVRLREANGWTDDYFPNAASAPAAPHASHSQVSYQQGWRLLEILFSTPLGTWIDHWEMRRKMRKLQACQNLSEAQFSKDWCKGHFEGHQHRILKAYQTRVAALHRHLELPEKQ
jgi:predicted nucleotidyltransferase